jgi:hypothetical protein
VKRKRKTEILASRIRERRIDPSGIDRRAAKATIPPPNIVPEDQFPNKPLHEARAGCDSKELLALTIIRTIG